MTKAELIEALAEYPDDMPVYYDDDRGPDCMWPVDLVNFDEEMERVVLV